MKKLMKNTLLIALIILISGCSLKQKSIENLTVVNETLPVINSEKIKLIPDITSVGLEWQGHYTADVDGYYIYRANVKENKEKFTRIAKIDDKHAKHYLDEKLEPNTEYLYMISIKGKQSTESLPTAPKLTKTLALLESVSLVYATSNLPRKVRIEWRPHTSQAVKAYLVERSSEEKPQWEEIAQVKNRLNAEYIDSDLKDNTSYSYRIKVVRFDGLISKPSEKVIATTKPLPMSPKNLLASKNEPKQITLSWNVSQQEDVVIYNIYASSNPEKGYKKVSEAPTYATTAIHKFKEDGKRYFYKITAVDKDGLESNLKFIPSVQGTSLTIPLKPEITFAEMRDNDFVVQWKSGDSRSVSYNVYKTIHTGFFSKKIKVYKDINILNFIDNDIKKGIKYEYQVEGIDEFGLVSQKSKVVTFKLPKE